MDLYACRHCKAEDAELKRETKYKGHQVYFAYYIQCRHCGSRTRDYPEISLALDAWNKACGEKRENRPRGNADGCKEMKARRPSRRLYHEES